MRWRATSKTNSRRQISKRNAAEMWQYIIGGAVLVLLLQWVVIFLIGVQVDKLNSSIAALTAAITALQGRIAGSVPVAQVEAAAAQIDQAVATLNSTAV